MTKIMKISVIIGTVKRYPCPIWNCLELETCSFKPTISFGFKRDFQSLLSSKSFNHHGSMATILGITDGEDEVVWLVWDGSDDLSNGTFSPSDQFNCSKTWRNRKVLIVDIFHWFQGFNDPRWEWWNHILYLGREKNSSWEVLEYMRTNFKVTVFHWVSWAIKKKKSQIKTQPQIN